MACPSHLWVPHLKLKNGPTPYTETFSTSSSLPVPRKKTHLPHPPLVGMALHICNCFALSNHNFHNKQSHTPLFSNSMPKASSLLQRHTSTVPPPPPTLTSPLFTKRKLSLSILAAAVFLNGFFPNLPKPIFAQELELERYTDSKEGFTLLRPSSWIKVFPFFH